MSLSISRENLTRAGMLFAFGLFLAGSLSSRTADSWGAFFPSNGFLVVLFLLVDKRHFLPVAGMAFVINVIIALTIGERTWGDALLGGFFNPLESFAAAWATARFCGRSPNFGSISTLARFGGSSAALIFPIIFGAMGVRTLYADFDPTLLLLFRTALEDWLGIVITVPALWTLVRRDRLHERSAFARSRQESFGLFALLIAGEAALLAQSEVPALFVVFPLLIAVSFRLGPVGAAWSIFLTATMTFGFTVAGVGPLAARELAGHSGTSLLLQLFVLSVATTVLPAAGAVSEQARLRQDLEEREARARAVSDRLELALRIAKGTVWEIDISKGEVVQEADLDLRDGRRFGYLELLTLAGLSDRSSYSESDPIQSVERQIEAKSGARWMQSHVRCISGADGASRVLGLTLDITDRKSLELQLLQAFQSGESVLASKRDLIQQIERELRLQPGEAEDAPQEERAAASAAHDLGELTRRLSNLFAEIDAREASLADAVEALRAARSAANAANVAKSHFLMNMSHELRTPLNAIIGYSEIVSEDLLGSSLQSAGDDLARIRNAAFKLLHMIDDVMLLTETDTDRSGVHVAAHSIDQFGEDVSAVARTWAADAKLELSLTLDAHGVAHFDAPALRRCALALLSNACRFTAAGGRIDLVLKQATAADGADTLVLSVADTGIGIAESRLAELFEPFTQSDTSSTRARDGAGLGLSIARKLAKRMGGDLSVRSKLGEGTVFELRVPAMFADAPAMARA